MLPRSLTTFAITMMTSICSYSLRSTTQLNSIPVESTKPYTSQKLQIAAGLAAEASKSCHTLSRRYFDLKLLFEPCQHYEHHTECRCWPGETRLDCKSLDGLRNNLAPTQRCYELSPLQDGPCGLCGCQLSIQDQRTETSCSRKPANACGFVFGSIEALQLIPG